MGEIIQPISKLNDTIARLRNPEVFLEDSLKKAIADLSAKDTTTTATTEPQDSTNLDELGLDTTSTTTADTTGAAKKEMSIEEQRKRSPLFSILPIINNQGTVLIGVSKVSDTSAVNAIIYSPLAKSILPPDLRLLWGSKTDNNQAQLYSIRDFLQFGNGKVSSSPTISVSAFMKMDGVLMSTMFMPSILGINFSSFGQFLYSSG